MNSKRRSHLPLVIFASIIFISARSKLPLISTKQSVSNLRFISKDGEYTYYQRRSGPLALTTSYETREVIKGQFGANYHIFSSPTRKKLLVAQELHFHTHYNPRAPQNIMALDFGGITPQKLGQGLSPRLHLADTWVSFFSSHNQILYFKNIKNPPLKFQIKLRVKKNPYFIPQAVMLSEQRVLYTDLNDEGLLGILLFERQKSNITSLSKGKSANENIEICLHRGSLYIGRFPLDDAPLGSEITRHFLPHLNSKDFKGEVLYRSPKADIGHLICHVSDTHLYFIQNQSSEARGRRSFEAVELELASQKVRVLSDLKYVTQIISMDGKLLIPYHGDYYILK